MTPALEKITIEFAPDTNAIRRSAEWLKMNCASIADEKIFELELAVVEAVTNIVRHGALPQDNEKILMELNCNDAEIEITIIDTGKSLDPSDLSNSEHALDYDPEDILALPSGGLGLAIIREATDGFYYETVDGRNVMRLVKNLGD